ncbi:hypothetical protein N0V93_002752 [Gnomoniopsis smithogilvyi]|uniref:Uncharacterized protein n=1 Tax=Gnomoniopsis smithogilvyi TaxID=1191159 RepID=A0A9W8YVD1_9PEZI|nr:hypothetical protein N0V93_002752 [Gnomoniopsis smithogilvyi]
MHRLSFLLLLLSACVSLAAAATAPTFCKCTCFTNSTIIEIKSTSKTPSSITGAHLAEPPNSEDTEDLTSSTQTNPSNEAPSDPVPETTNRLLPRSKRAQLSPSCNQCNRAFCLAQSLPICKGAEEKDVVTMCFQRDSRKDQIIVWGFILGTAGLLGWAAVRKAWEMQESGGLPSLLSGGGGLRAGGGNVPLGRAGGGFVGASGSDLGRGQYATVAGHSRDGSESLG